MTVPMSISLLAALQVHGTGMLEVTVELNSTKIITGYLWAVGPSSEGNLVLIGEPTDKEYYYVHDITNCDFNMCHHCDLGVAHV